MRARSLRRAVPGLLGIIGSPVRSSLSPAMHNAALARMGLDARYLAFDIGPDQVRPVLRALPALGFWGLNVTIPYKERVAGLLDDLDASARELGAVNTIAVEGGRLIGHNTDGRGFLAALAEAGIDPRGLPALLVGAGGAARAIAVALARAGASRVALANRTRARAVALGRLVRRVCPGTEALAVGAEGAAFERCVAGSRLLVNTTPLGGRRGDPLPVPPRLIDPGHLVADIVYRPVRTPLLAVAEARGARAVGGLGMLLHQGALAFRIWTGLPAPVEVMRRALLAANAGAR